MKIVNVRYLDALKMYMIISYCPGGFIFLLIFYVKETVMLFVVSFGTHYERFSEALFTVSSDQVKQ